MKKTLVLAALTFIISVLITGVKNPSSVSASSENVPAAPVITAKSTDDGKIIVTISKTENASGYRIYVKLPGASKYKKIKTLKKKGTVERSYTYACSVTGKYAFKVKAYTVEDGKKIWSKASKAVKLKVKNIPLSIEPGSLIAFKEDVQTEFTLMGNNPGETDVNPYNVEYTCDDSLKDSFIRLRIVDKNGSPVSDPPAWADAEQYTLYVNRLGTFYIAFFSYENIDDADSHQNPTAMSSILKIRSVNEEGLTGEEPKIYADITFKNGYAYFGTAPLKQVTDKALVSKILSVPENTIHEREYNGEKYIYDTQDKKGPFQFVPVEWRILEQTDDYVLLMSNSILNGGGYDGYAESKTTLWKNSCLYYMLNDQNSYTKSERTYSSVLNLSERVLMDMDMAGTPTKIGIPTIDILTDPKYGFSKDYTADKNRIVSPSEYYSQTTNNNAVKNGKKIFGNYWVVNEKAGTTVTVDTKGTICKGDFACNTYEVGVVAIIKVNLTHCTITK